MNIRLLDHPNIYYKKSKLARGQVERFFSLERTYGKLTQALYGWVIEKTSISV